MKNYSNIYDIDGNLIRSAGDNHKFNIEDIKKRIDYYYKKYEELDEKDPKKAVYSTYLRNLNNYMLSLYSEMPKNKKIELQEQINKAIEELKKDVEDDGTAEADTTDEIQESITGNNESNTDTQSGNDEIIGREQRNVHEERPLTQSDLLVERDNVNTVMDEYVPYTEVN